MCQIINLLVSSDADINNQDQRKVTPLMSAAKTSSVETVNLLLSKSADPNLLDQDGLPALGYALKSGNEEIIQTLAKHTTAGLENCVSLYGELIFLVLPAVLPVRWQYCRDES